MHFLRGRSDEYLAQVRSRHAWNIHYSSGKHLSYRSPRSRNRHWHPLDLVLHGLPTLGRHVSCCQCLTLFQRVSPHLGHTSWSPFCVLLSPGDDFLCHPHFVPLGEYNHER